MLPYQEFLQWRELVSGSVQQCPSERYSFFAVPGPYPGLPSAAGQYDGGTLEQGITKRCEEAAAVYRFGAIVEVRCRFGNDDATRAVSQSGFRKEGQVLVQPGQGCAVRAVTAGGQVEGQLIEQCVAERQQMLGGEAGQAADGGIGTLTSAEAAKNRPGYAGQLLQARGKIAGGFQCPGRAHGGAEQAAPAAFAMNGAPALQGESPVRAQVDTTPAAASAEAHPQAAGAINLHVIPAAG